MADRKLQSWVEAGLIDAETAQRISAWEDSHSRPLALWALIGLGALAIGLGLISLVAANWDVIAGQLRLALHGVFLLGVAAAIWWRAQNIAPEADYFHEALLFIFGALALTFFGHLGQVYQTMSPLWQPMLAWTLLMTPLLLIAGRSWPSATMWVGAIIFTSIAHAVTRGFGYNFGAGYVAPEYPATYWGLIATPPMFAAALGAWARSRSARHDYWQLIEQLSVFAIMAGVSIAIIFRGGATKAASQDLVTAGFHFAALLILACAIYAFRRSQSGQSTVAILVAAALMQLVAVAGAGSTIIPALAFIILWAAVALAAIHAKWRAIFQIAVGLIAFRLVILSLELNDNLLTSGAGLVLSGLLTLAVAWIAVRVSNRFAPAKEAKA